MITITKECAAENLELLHSLNGLAKLANGDYVIFMDNGWSACSPDDAAADLSQHLDSVDLIRSRICELGEGTVRIPDPVLLYRSSADNDVHEFRFDTETEYGEPQCWIYLKDGTSIELTHEEHGLIPKTQYFSLRLHCSEEDFENDVYHGTMGVIEQFAGTLSEIAPELQRILDERHVDDEPRPVIHCIKLPSKKLAEYEDAFEDAIFHAAHDLLYDCTQGRGIPGYDAFVHACLDSDLHNYVKTAFYDMFRSLGFDIKSDGTSF